MEFKLLTTHKRSVQVHSEVFKYRIPNLGLGQFPTNVKPVNKCPQAIIVERMVSISDTQKQIVKDTWEIPKKNPLDSGEVIFIRFLEKYPHNKEKFAAFKNIPMLSLKVAVVESNIGTLVLILLLL